MGFKKILLGLLFASVAFASGNAVQTFKDPVAFGYSTANRACYLDANKELQASLATSTELGYLSGVTSAIQTQLNGKQATLTIGNFTDAGTDGISVTNGAGAVIGSGTSIAQHVADSTHNGYLSASNWSLFNGKQDALVFTAPIINTSGTITCNVASGSQPGCLSAADWTTFNSKQNSLTLGNLTVGTGLSVSGGTGAVVGSGTSVSIGAGYYLPTTTDKTYWNALLSQSCAAGQYGNGTGSTGGLLCAQVAYSQLSGTPTIYYQTVQANGTDQTQRAKLNFSSQFSLTDSASPAKTTVDLASTITSNTSGTAAGLSATLGAGSGGTGQTSIAAAFTSFYESVATTLGDIIYGGASGAPTRLAGNTSSTAKMLVQTGTGSASASPGWIAVGGDCTMSATGSFTCTKTNGTSFAASATTDATNANNILAGLLGPTYGGTGLDTHASTGFPHVSSGTWAVNSDSSTFTTLYETVATTLGDLLYGGASGAPTRLAGDTSNTRKFLREQSSGGVAAAPAWDTLVSGDIPNLDTSKLTTGQLGAARGGTGLDTSGSTGIPAITSGTWAINSLATTFANLFKTIATAAGDLVYGGASGTPTRLAAGSAYQILRMNSGATAPEWVDFPDPSHVYWKYTDFDTLIPGNTMTNAACGADLWCQASGTSANITDGSSSFTNANPGVANFSTGTTTTGWAGVGTGPAPAKSFYVGGGNLTIEWNWDVSALSDGTNTYTLVGGMLDTGPTSASSATTGATNGMYFYYSNGVNSGNLEYVTCNAGTCTVNTTSTPPVTSGFQKMTIKYKTATPSVEFDISGSQQGSDVTTNLPPTNVALRYYFFITKTAGTAARSMYIDFFKAFMPLTTAR